MPTIESVNIQGFWGNHSVFLKFDPEVSFLVGRNGSGKTTAINILASALHCDEDALERLPFQSIEITFFDRETKKKPSIIVQRLDGEEGQFPSITYRIKETAKTSIKDARLFSPFDYRGSPPYRTKINNKGQKIRVRVPPKYALHELQKEISRLVKTNWLSINRASTIRSSLERGSNETSVDQKLREISERLVRYFSELSNEASQEARVFQRKLFRSLIRIDTIGSLSGIVTDMDLDAEEAALTDIFDRFDIPKEEYHDDANRFFSHLEEIQGEDDKSAYTHDDLVALINAHKIHSLVDDWNEAVLAEKEAVKPRDAFVKILNNMFHRKKAVVLPSGEFVFHTQSGKDLNIYELSSGEKQLFIILGEALLQKDAEWTYIADEPELSLHVDWQEVLVENLRALNPNSQVIFATHSPDIVSHYSKNVIDMEKAIYDV